MKCIYDKSAEDMPSTAYPSNEFGAWEEMKIEDNFAEIEIWPPIHARFIRLRPFDYHQEIAMRFDLYGPNGHRLEFARVVQFGTLSKEYKPDVRKKFHHVSANTRIIQYDCRAIIRKALNEAGMVRVGYGHICSQIYFVFI